MLSLTQRKIKNAILAIVITAIAILIASLLTGKYIEGILFFFIHWFIREQFPKQYHYVVPSMCRTVSAIVFFFGTCFILPFNMSILSAVPICYFIGWVGYKAKLGDLYLMNIDKPFNINTCTEKELRKRCEQLRISTENTELAVEFFIKQTKQSIIAERLCIDEKSVTTRKKRLKQKLQ